MQTVFFQSFVFNKLGEYLSKEMGGQLKFKEAYFSPFSGLSVNQLFIEDSSGDTLLFLEQFQVELKGFNSEESRVELSSLRIENGFYNLYSVNEKNQTNMQYILDYFSSPVSEKDSSASVFMLNTNSIDISNLRFKYQRLQYDSLNDGVDFDDIEISEFNLQAENFRLLNDSMTFDLKQLFIDEKSGFELSNLKGFTTVSSSEISINNLMFKTPYSNIFASRFSMKYADWSEMSEFIDKVDFHINLQLSTINIIDIAFFSPEVKNINLPAYAKGIAYGPISNLRSKRLQLNLGEESKIDLKFSIQGLPIIEETFLSLDIKNIDITSPDVQEFMKTQNFEKNIELPLLLKKLNRINYKGNITGFLSDLVAYGTFKNNFGLLKTDVRFKYNPIDKSFFYKGKVKTTELDLAVLNLSDTIFGNISLDGQMELENDSSNNYKGHLDGNIEALEVNQYNYKNIVLNADIDQLIIQSEISINDENIVADLNSKIDLSLDEPYFDFSGILHKARPAKINWIGRDLSSQLSFKIEGQFSSLNLDKFFGEVTIGSFTYAELGKEIYSEEFNMQSFKSDKYRYFEIYSDVLDAKLEGDFIVKDLRKYFENIGHSYLPSIFLEDKKHTSEGISNHIFDFRVQLKNSKNIFDIFSPQFRLANQSSITGSLDHENEQLSLSFNTDSCKINELILEQIDWEITGTKEVLFSDFSTQYFEFSEDLFFEDLNVCNSLKSDSLGVDINWSKEHNTNDLGAEIIAEVLINPSSFDSLSFDINMIPSYLFIEDSIWFLNDSKLKLRGSQTEIDNLVINNERQYLFVDGAWKKDNSDSLRLIFNGLDLSYFPIIERKTKLKMRGIVNGDLILGYKNQQPMITGNLQTDTLKINDRLLGNTNVDLNWDSKNEKLNISATNTIGTKGLKSFKSRGHIDFKSSKLHLNSSLNMQEISFFEPFLEGYISELGGWVSGDINISGPFNKLDYRGELEITRGEFFFDYLGTKYNLSDKIEINNNRFKFNNIKVYQVDSKGDYASINGYIEHQSLDDFNFFIDIYADKFMALNTSEKDNELYYGTAFITGLTQITGTPKNLKIDISASTNQGTRFFIPLSDAEEASGNDFISFVSDNRNKKSKTIPEYEIDLSGIILNFNLKTTPDAEIQLIFDDKMGDVVKARGEGDLNLNINTLGTFSMSGNYVITKGDYLFTLQNVINKRFKIEPGSNIKWNGDPYKAFVDIDAIYRLKTPLFDLTQNIDDKTRVPVECHLDMKNSLLAPDIAFDIKLPLAGDRAKSTINAMDQDEKNKQLLSLLVLSRFYTPDYLQGGEQLGSNNEVGKNASELLSNQLSNWLSGVSDDFDIGVNYRPGDEITNQELEVALSTQLFNDRINIDGALGVGEYKQSTSNVVGNVNVDVKINKKGNVRIRGFNRVNENELENNSLYTQGVGLYYREDFDSFGELLNKYWKMISFQSKKDSLNKAN